MEEPETERAPAGAEKTKEGFLETKEETELIYEPEPLRASLVEFEEPVLKGEKEDVSENVPRGKRVKKLSVRQILNTILPPREFVDMEGRTLVQQVSTRPAERDDAVALQLRLDEQLQKRQARENGICPVREEVYSQCLDELIRQVTLETPERGLLLMRVRDEVRMTVAAYRTLYQSSIHFGQHKKVQAEEGICELKNTITDLKARKQQLEDELKQQKLRRSLIDKRSAECRVGAEKRVNEETDFLKHQAQHLEAFLKTMKTSK